MGNEYFVDPFLKILPTLDVHGETSDTVIFLVKDFVNINRKMNHLKVCIIHGRHSHILKNAIHAYLKKDNNVFKYYTYGSNDGVTIVEIKPKIGF